MSKLTKDDLRSPDDFLKASRSAYRWMQDRWFTGILVVVLIFVGTISVLYWNQVKNKKEAEAQHVYGELLSLYEQWQLAVETGAKEKNLADLQALWSELTQAHHGTQASELGHQVMGRLAYAQANYEQALIHFEAYVDALAPGERDLGWYPLAQTHEALGDWEEAVSVYNQILAAETSSLEKWALLGKARSLRQTQSWDEALAAYDEFLMKFPNSPETAEVRGLKLLVKQRKIL